MNPQKTEVKKNSLKAWILAARPKTLSGAAVPVILGLAMAWYDLRKIEGWEFNFKAATLCMLFAFIMQIDANFINDFFDFAKGTDDRETRLGPRRACAEGWVSLHAMKHAIALTTCLACLCGLPLLFYGGLEMLLIGLLCVVFCFLYSTHLSYHGWGDVLVLVFFGIIPVCITYYIQMHTVTLTVFILSVACGLVIDALLLVNNFRDRTTDRQAGKMTLVVRLGEKKSMMAYLLCGLTGYLFGLVFVFQGCALAFVLSTFYLLLHLLTYAEMNKIWEGKELNRCLGHTARNIFIYGLTVAAGLILSSI